MVAPRRNSKLKHLNIHIAEDRDLYACDIRVSRKDRRLRRIRYFDNLSCAVEWRNDVRDELGLPPAEDA